jgi:hypothetical protein
MNDENPSVRVLMIPAGCSVRKKIVCWKNRRPVSLLIVKGRMNADYALQMGNPDGVKMKIMESSMVKKIGLSSQ